MHVARYHRSVNRADYIFKTVAAVYGVGGVAALYGSEHQYSSTGEDLRRIAAARRPTEDERKYTNWAMQVHQTPRTTQQCEC